MTAKRAEIDQIFLLLLGLQFNDAVFQVISVLDRWWWCFFFVERQGWSQKVQPSTNFVGG